MRLQGKVCLVTGAAKRVGRTVAMALAQRGAKIAIHYGKSRQEAQRLADEIKESFGRESAIFHADLSNVRQAEKMVDQVGRQFGTIHVLVNNAAIYEKSDFGEVEHDDWDRHMDINLRAPFFVAQAASAYMKEAGEGKIINLADWAGLRPYIDYIPYCISKAGVICMTHALAKALAPTVQVNAILPGPVLLPESFSPKTRAAVIQATPLKRLGSPEDIAQTILFLIEGSDFLTGACIPVDGGRLIA